MRCSGTFVTLFLAFFQNILADEDADARELTILRKEAIEAKLFEEIASQWLKQGAAMKGSETSSMGTYEITDISPSQLNNLERPENEPGESSVLRDRLKRHRFGSLDHHKLHQGENIGKKTQDYWQPLKKSEVKSLPRKKIHKEPHEGVRSDLKGELLLEPFMAYNRGGRPQQLTIHQKRSVPGQTSNVSHQQNKEHSIEKRHLTMDVAGRLGSKLFVQLGPYAQYEHQTLSTLQLNPLPHRILPEINYYLEKTSHGIHHKLKKIRPRTHYLEKILPQYRRIQTGKWKKMKPSNLKYTRTDRPTHALFHTTEISKWNQTIEKLYGDDQSATIDGQITLDDTSPTTSTSQTPTQLSREDIIYFKIPTNDHQATLPSILRESTMQSSTTSPTESPQETLVELEDENDLHLERTLPGQDEALWQTTNMEDQATHERNRMNTTEANTEILEVTTTRQFIEAASQKLPDEVNHELRDNLLEVNTPKSSDELSKVNIGRNVTSESEVRDRVTSHSTPRPLEEPQENNTQPDANLRTSPFPTNSVEIYEQETEGSPGELTPNFDYEGNSKLTFNLVANIGRDQLQNNIETTENNNSIHDNENTQISEISLKNHTVSPYGFITTSSLENKNKIKQFEELKRLYPTESSDYKFVPSRTSLNEADSVRKVFSLIESLKSNPPATMNSEDQKEVTPDRALFKELVRNLYVEEPVAHELSIKENNKKENKVKASKSKNKGEEDLNNDRNARKLLMPCLFPAQHIQYKKISVVKNDMNICSEARGGRLLNPADDAIAEREKVGRNKETEDQIFMSTETVPENWDRSLVTEEMPLTFPHFTEITISLNYDEIQSTTQHEDTENDSQTKTITQDFWTNKLHEKKQFNEESTTTQAQETETSSTEINTQIEGINQESGQILTQLTKTSENSKNIEGNKKERTIHSLPESGRALPMSSNKLNMITNLFEYSKNKHSYLKDSDKPTQVIKAIEPNYSDNKRIVMHLQESTNLPMEITSIIEEIGENTSENPEGVQITEYAPDVLQTSASWPSEDTDASFASAITVTDDEIPNHTTILYDEVPKCTSTSYDEVPKCTSTSYDEVPYETTNIDSDASNNETNLQDQIYYKTNLYDEVSYIRTSKISNQTINLYDEASDNETNLCDEALNYTTYDEELLDSGAKIVLKCNVKKQSSDTNNWVKNIDKQLEKAVVEDEMYVAKRVLPLSNIKLYNSPDPIQHFAGMQDYTEENVQFELPDTENFTSNASYKLTEDKALATTVPKREKPSTEIVQHDRIRQNRINEQVGSESVTITEILAESKEGAVSSKQLYDNINVIFLQTDIEKGRGVTPDLKTTKMEYSNNYEEISTEVTDSAIVDTNSNYGFENVGTTEVYEYTTSRTLREEISTEVEERSNWEGNIENTSGYLENESTVTEENLSERPLLKLGNNVNTEEYADQMTEKYKSSDITSSYNVYDKANNSDFDYMLMVEDNRWSRASEEDLENDDPSYISSLKQIVASHILDDDDAVSVTTSYNLKTKKILENTNFNTSGIIKEITQTEKAKIDYDNMPAGPSYCLNSSQIQPTMDIKHTVGSISLTSKSQQLATTQQIENLNEDINAKGEDRIARRIPQWLLNQQNKQTEKNNPKNSLEDSLMLELLMIDEDEQKRIQALLPVIPVIVQDLRIGAVTDEDQQVLSDVFGSRWADIVELARRPPTDVERMMQQDNVKQHRTVRDTNKSVSVVHSGGFMTPEMKNRQSQEVYEPLKKVHNNRNAVMLSISDKKTSNSVPDGSKDSKTARINEDEKENSDVHRRDVDYEERLKEYIQQSQEDDNNYDDNNYNNFEMQDDDDNADVSELKEVAQAHINWRTITLPGRRKK